MFAKDFDYTVCFSRIIGMVMIVICHLGTAFNNGIIGQGFQVGVQLFLFISGYLYSKKDLGNLTKWFKSRYLRLGIPFYLFIFYIAIVNIILNNKMDYRSFILYLFNIQGYYHIFCDVSHIEPVLGTAHLWFLSVIWLCYLFTPLLQLINKNLSNCKIYWLLFILFCLSVVLGSYSIRIDYFYIYILGYFYNRLNKIKIWKIIVYLSFFLSILGRLAGKYYSDVYGDNAVYLYIIIPITYNFLSLSIYYFYSKIGVYLFKFICKYSLKNVVSYLDKITFFVYITHYQFIEGPFYFTRYEENMLLGVSLFFIFTFITSNLLYFCNDIIIKYFFRIRME